MSVTATELQSNLSKYLLLAATEDVFITQYGRIVAKLTNPYRDSIEIAESLFGILPQTTTFEETREERNPEHFRQSPVQVFSPSKFAGMLNNAQ